MSYYFTTIADVFERGADERLDLGTERELLAAAQTGDSDAQLRLIRAYGAALRNGVAFYTRALPGVPQTVDLEDVRSQAVMGLLEAIQAFDPEVHERLAAIAASYIRNSVAAAAGPVAAFTVPERTLKRFFGILRAADGDVRAAADLAPEYEMKRETVLAVLAAVRNVDSYDLLAGAVAVGSGGGGWTVGLHTEEPNVQPLNYTPVVDVDDAILVEAAFGAVDDLERDVIRQGYGFTEYEPLPDAEIAARMGYSRPKIQRVRSAGVQKMRSALGVA